MIDNILIYNYLIELHSGQSGLVTTDTSEADSLVHIHARLTVANARLGREEG